MKTINDLRDVLFETLQAVKEGAIDLDRAKTMNDLAQTIVNTAKAEVDHMKVTGGQGSGFIAAAAADGRRLTHNGSETIHALGPGANVITHRMRG